MKVLLDTNIIIRLLVKDHEAHYQEVLELFDLIEQGSIKPYLSNIVILEITYVLQSFYNREGDEVREVIEDLLELRGMSIIEKTDTKKALSLQQKYKVKFTDCLIATQVMDGVTLITFDKDFNKIREIKSVVPADILRR